MKRVIRKFDLSSLVPAMALAALFTACGDDSGSNGDENESVVTVPSDIKLADGNKVVCDEDMEGVVAVTADAGYLRCEDGRWIEVSEDEALSADKIIGAVEGKSSSSSKGQSSSSAAKVSSSSKGESSSSAAKVSSSSKDESSSSAAKGSSSSKDEDASTLYRCDADGKLYKDPEECPSHSDGITSSDTPGTDPDVTPSSSSSVTPSSSSSVTPSSSSSVIPSEVEGSSSSVTSSSSAKFIEYDVLVDRRDGQQYKTVKICDDKNENCQTWMAQNLNYNINPGEQSWCGGGVAGTTTEGDCSVYGRLYTWAAAVDSVAIYKYYDKECGNTQSCWLFSATALATAPVQGVCPDGWHLPSNAEWSALYTNVGGTGTAGQKLKAKTSLWYSNTGTDEYGFSVLPAGGCFDPDCPFRGGKYAFFWSSTEDDYFAWYQEFYYGYDGVYQELDINKSHGFSVRCLKD